MAKIKFGGGVADIRGHIGGVVFSRNSSGAYMREKVTPVNPSTPKQALVRARMDSLSKSWATLTQVQRDGWADLARAFPKTDIFGNPVTLSGIAQYQSTNGRILQMALVRLDDPPANLDVIAPLSLSISLIAATRVAEIAWDISPTPDNIGIYLFATRRHSAGVSFLTNLFRFMIFEEGSLAAPFTPPVPDAFGPINVGDTLSFRFHFANTDNGALSVGLIATAVAI